MWVKRHRGILAILWVHAGALAVFGVVLGHGLLHSAAEAGIVAALAAVAW